MVYTLASVDESVISGGLKASHVIAFCSSVQNNKVYQIVAKK